MTASDTSPTPHFLTRLGFYKNFLLGIIILILIAAGGYYWYQHLPKIPKITAVIIPPEITKIDTPLVPAPVIINFGIQKDADFTAASVAPLTALNKPLTQGIETNPRLAGVWSWKNDKQLLFIPAKDWPPGQTYSLKFAKTLFAKHIKLGAYHYAFSTLPFAITGTDFKFYQDLKNPQQTQVIATLHFNFPVNSKSLEQHTRLMLQQLKNNKPDLQAPSYAFNVTYDAYKRTAYLRSTTIPPLVTPRYVQLVITPGVEAENGNSLTATTTPYTASVLIPAIGSFLQITKATTAIIRDANDKPQQLLTLETSLGVSNNELNNYLRVYLLPKDLPATALQPATKNYAWHQPGEVSDKILSQSQQLNLAALPEEHPFPTLHSWQFSAATPRYLYIKINKGVIGFGGFPLTTAYQAIVKVAPIPEEINFLHKGALISLSGEKKLTVLVRGVPTVKFTIARVFTKETNHLVSQTRGDFQDPNFLHASFNRNDISELFAETREFNITNPSDLQYTTLDLQQYLLQAKTPTLGLFLIKAQGWDKANNQPTAPETNRLILVTDMGLLVKNNADATHDVFVQSISSGLPVADAEVAILGRNGLPIIKGLTDDSGHTQLASVADFKDEHSPTVYLVQHGEDISFIPYDRADRQLNFSRFDVDGINDSELNSLTAFLFSDRGIYRPGDLMHVGIVIKQKFATLQPPGLPLEATLTDPRGVTVLDQKFSLPASGLLTLDYRSAATAPTGTYTVNVFLVKDGQKDNLLGSTQVRVEEFLPDRLKAHARFMLGSVATTAPNGWLSPQALHAQLQLNNLYGTPAAHRRVVAKILLAPQLLTFAQYKNYVFVDPLLNPNQPLKVFSDDLTDAQTNAQGIANFNLNLTRFDRATYQLTFFAEGFEADGGRGVSTQISTLVTPLNYLMGYKADSDLNYLKPGSQASVNFIAINANLIKIPLTHLQAQILSVHTVSTLVKNPDGAYKYQSIKQEQPIATTAFNLLTTGSDFNLPTTTVGDYALTLRDSTDHLITKLYFSVVGASRHAVTKNAELSVKLLKNTYNAGDNIEMQITAPYAGAGLISIERDKVYTYKWFKTATNTTTQTIQIPQDFQGNGYVTIAFVRDWNSDAIFVNPLSYRVIPFNLSAAAHTIAVNLDTPKLVKPGDDLVINYHTNIPSKIIIFAVDQGILQVTNYALPDPLGSFFSKRALSVTTAQIVDQILPKYISNRELSAIGGDDANKALANNLNPFKRKTEAPVIYWSGILDSDSNTRRVTYKIPDYFNGNLQVMAVAVAANAVGSAQKNTSVRGDFIINPNTPTFVGPGDLFTVAATIANNLNAATPAASTLVSLTTSKGLKIIGSSQQSVAIPAGQEHAVEFKVKASTLLGNASLQFTASQGTHQAHYTSTLSVRPTAAYQTTLQSGSDQASTKKLTITRQLYPQYRILQVQASANPLSLVHGLQGYLHAYPYNCTEQLISTAFAQLAIAKQPLFASTPQTLQASLDKLVQLLRQRLTSEGGFSYWPGEQGDTEDSQFSSVYAMDFLTTAKQQGYFVPPDLLENGIQYLQNFAKQDTTNLAQARLQAYAIYLLTRNEIVTTSYLTHLQLYLSQQPHWQQDISSVYLAATYKLLKNDDEALNLIRGYSLKTPPQTIATTDVVNTLATQAQYIILLARHFPERLKNLGTQPIMALTAGINSDQLNTLSAAYSAIALSTYAQTVGSNNATHLAISQLLTNHVQEPLPSLKADYQLANFSPQAIQILFNNPENQVYFYQLQQSGFNLINASQPINAGLEVFRDYRNANNTTSTETKLGDEIVAHIQIRSLTKQLINHVAIVDLLPGGFDVVAGSVQQNRCDYVDVREDRIIFYCSVTPDASELSYRLRAVNKGVYRIPPIMARAMYKESVQSTGVEGGMLVQ